VAAEAGDLVAAQQRLDSADELIPGIRHAVDEVDRLDALSAQAIIARGVDPGPVARTPAVTSG
jgi:hypothetical protein